MLQTMAKRTAVNSEVWLKWRRGCREGAGPFFGGFGKYRNFF